MKMNRDTSYFVLRYPEIPDDALRSCQVSDEADIINRKVKK